MNLFQVNDIGYVSKKDYGSNILYSCGGDGIFNLWDIKNKKPILNVKLSQGYSIFLSIIIRYSNYWSLFKSI